MTRPPIRAITLGIADPHPISVLAIDAAAAQVRQAERAYRDAGYEVQSVRLSTRPAFDDLASADGDALVAYAIELQASLEGAGIEFCSLGPAPAWRDDHALDRLATIGEVLVRAPALSCTVQVAMPEAGLRAEAAIHAARIVRRLATETDEGFGTFRFAALACVEPGSPFLPAAYHAGPPALSVGWQGASVVADALRDPSPAPPEERIRDAVAAAGEPVVEVGRRVASALGVRFGGIDVSPAPAGDDSIGEALELLAGGPLGVPGTLAAAATITAGIRGTMLPTCGYAGLMLPVMEDTILARRWAEGRLDLDQLLAWSAVCGTGLDAVPLPGDVGDAELAGIMLDVASLALRLRKPLSARLMPIPGASAGDLTAFSSPYLVNTVVRAVGGGTRPL